MLFAFVMTGVVVRDAGKDSEVADHEKTLVRFRALGDDEIAAYVATGEPMDKAGAYAIQGFASVYIPKIEGSYSNVMGFPLALVWELLAK